MVYAATAHNRIVYASPLRGLAYSRNVMRNSILNLVEKIT
jgi:hypothetical protein